MQMPKAITVGVLRKKVFFKISQSSQGTPVPEETPLNSAKFLRTPFLQKNSGRLLLKADIAITKREMLCIGCRELDAMLIASAKIPEREGRILPFSFYGHLSNYSHTY